MARTMSVPCRRDLACYRNDGHPGECMYPTPDTEPQPTAAIPEAHRVRSSNCENGDHGDCAAMVECETEGHGLHDCACPCGHRAVPEAGSRGLDVERLAEAIRLWYVKVGRNPDTGNFDQPQASWLAREYAALADTQEPTL